MKYLEFINEAKVTDLKPGVKVMFNGKFRYEGGPLVNLDFLLHQKYLRLTDPL
jgi:hypothetical protein